MIRNKPIGVFDSGLGGLTVLSAIRKRLPSEHLVYFGDTARVPYGGKSKETIIRYSLEILDFLLSKNSKIIVVACNTASSYALSVLREKSPVPVIGVIEPGVRALLKNYPSVKKAAVIATKSTINSGSYKESMQNADSSVTLLGRACPLLVPLVEEGMQDSEAAGLILKSYLDELLAEDIKHLILGCTHYPLMSRAIHAQYPEIALIDSSAETALELEELIINNRLHNSSTTPGVVYIYVSDMTDSIQSMQKAFFDSPVTSLLKVALRESL